MLVAQVTACGTEHAGCVHKRLLVVQQHPFVADPDHVVVEHPGVDRLGRLLGKTLEFRSHLVEPGHRLRGQQHTVLTGRRQAVAPGNIIGGENGNHPVRLLDFDQIKPQNAPAGHR